LNPDNYDNYIDYALNNADDLDDKYLINDREYTALVQKVAVTKILEFKFRFIYHLNYMFTFK